MNEQTSVRTAFTDFIEPVWYQELASSLAVRAQFVISGNVRDVYPIRGRDKIEFVDFEGALWSILKAKGVQALLIHDPVEGLRLHHECSEDVEAPLKKAGLTMGAISSTPREIADLATLVSQAAEVPMTLVLDYASTQIKPVTEEVQRLFIAMDKLSRGPGLVRPRGVAASPPRNPVIWMLDRAGDLPDWFVTRNPGLRELMLGLPDLSERKGFIDFLAGSLPDAAQEAPDQRDENVEQFAVSCDDMSMMDIYGVIELARAEGVALADIELALRNYRLGTTRNPWTSTALRSRIRNAKPVLESRVKGQPRALERTYDILVRSIMGLSGAQTTNRGNRPRGALFFVGPTGVGKTELAKSVANVIFGDESAMNRYDMSEFMSEDSIGRLIGPAPGMPGHENGGDLVNAIRARPFGVYLFDEIEKGHPRVLDMFLQILDDGRLSDTRGETGFFSEALIIFTSNIGMVGGDKANNSGHNVLPSDSPEAVERKLREAVTYHFRYELRRPELMNRLGQNIVPFQFINTRSSVVIFEAVIKRVLQAAHEEHDIDIVLTDEARARLLELCTFDLMDGGRGIGNRIESSFINPLSRLLFSRDVRDKLVIAGVEEKGEEVRLLVEGDDEDE